MLSIDRILVISPHTDDGEVACGGSIVKFLEKKINVYYVAFSSCEKSVPEDYARDILKIECKNATKILGIQPENVILFDYEVRTFPLNRQKILEDLVNINKEFSPELVLVPSSNDTHQDHQTINLEALRAFKKTSSIWGYEHPWNNLTFTTDIFVKLDEKHIRKKIEALKQYESQNFREYFDEKYLISLAYTRGMQVNFPYAEAFELIRQLVE